VNQKVEVLMHPVRIKICMALLRNNDNGLTPLEMVKMIQDVPQATLYRHIQVMADTDIIYVVKEKKVKSVSEKYYALNEAEAKFDKDEWNQTSSEDKLNYISYYQLFLLSKYQNYLETLEKQSDTEDHSTFSVVELKLDDEHFTQFQNELNELMERYYHTSSKRNEKSNPARTVGITIVPEG